MTTEPTKTVCRIYGIKNCATMKKTFDWFETHGINYCFHDYKKTGADRVRLQEWCKQAGISSLVNTRGTTWRKLPPEKQCIDTEDAAINLMLEHPSLIKRPVVETASGLLVGFDPQSFADRLK